MESDVQEEHHAVEAWLGQLLPLPYRIATLIVLGIFPPNPNQIQYDLTIPKQQKKANNNTLNRLLALVAQPQKPHLLLNRRPRPPPLPPLAASARQRPPPSPLPHPAAARLFAPLRPGAVRLLPRDVPALRASGSQHPFFAPLAPREGEVPRYVEEG